MRKTSQGSRDAHAPARQSTRASHTQDPFHQALRALPSVDALCRDLGADGDVGHIVGHVASTRAARAALAEARAAIRAAAPAPGRAELLARARQILRDAARPSLRPVLNATGVIVNTNLGRAPLSATAIQAVIAVARGYSNLEYDLADGTRGSRQTHLRALLQTLTGAEDALVVNNNAAAVLVALSALAAGREAIISRGELVEIGGGFRIPDVMRQSGARLVEVGTTNRTRVRDYADAITSETALLLAVHPSNFRIVGFTEAPELAPLVELAHARGLLVMHDLGSGCFASTQEWSLAREPTPRESIAAGADVVCFSGDKLLGGPQAGVIVGRHASLARIERHPLMRAIRTDKLSLAALEATLIAYRDGAAREEIPVWRAIAAPLATLRARAERWAAAARNYGLTAAVIEGESTIGGGSLPGETLPTRLCALAPEGGDVEALARRLRLGDPAVVGRVLRGNVLLDPRTVSPEQDASLLEALRAASSSSGDS